MNSYVSCVCVCVYLGRLVFITNQRTTGVTMPNSIMWFTKQVACPCSLLVSHGKVSGCSKPQQHDYLRHIIGVAEISTKVAIGASLDVAGIAVIEHRGHRGTIMPLRESQMPQVQRGPQCL